LARSQDQSSTAPQSGPARRKQNCAAPVFLVHIKVQDYHDGLAFVLDQSLKGILLGQGPDELRYSVQLPKRLREAPILIQNYGELSIMPPRIFTAIFGQFDRNAATLIKLQPTEEAERMINAMGGEGRPTISRPTPSRTVTSSGRASWQIIW
jgi:alkyl sulfatase BDS1-like metallo-beta-lactamase superfamily hydrolase